MKKDQNKRLGLQKLTIAKLDSQAMKKIHGGDCLPTEHWDDNNPPGPGQREVP